MEPYASRRVAIVRPLRYISRPRITRYHSSSSSNNDEDDWPIRFVFLSVTLKDVACEQQVTRLRQWLDLFSISSQPQSDEEQFYVMIIVDAIEQKLANLASHS